MPPPPYFWQKYTRLNGFYNGIRTLVPYSQWRPENGYHERKPLNLDNDGQSPLVHSQPPVDPIVFDPYPKDDQMLTCYLDSAETIAPPDVMVYPGIPQHMTDPFYGDHDLLGMDQHVCFERYGRLGSYGFGWNETYGGWGPGLNAEQRGAEKIFQKTGFPDYGVVDWGEAQRRCYQKNEARLKGDPMFGRKKTQRQAYVLRAWTGIEYTSHVIYMMRSMITELSLKSGGEYDVHLLVHVKDDSLPIWADASVYQKVLQKNVPKEFWNITTLWSQKLIEMYYPDPYTWNFANMAKSNVHGVYRSAHFPLQWFSQQHPEYDHFWNWEMDLRFTGHYYDFNNKISQWAKKQPRKGLWERSKKFYIPKYHGDWNNFTNFVEREIEEVDKLKNDEKVSGPVPVWGPVKDWEALSHLDSPEGTTPPTSYEQDNYEWGVGEEADLMVFNPIFDPSSTNWVFRLDASGYDPEIQPPPRRTAIITVARLSKRLLDMMHRETWEGKHTMFPEMWPPTVALHHGLKAVYVPHPVYFDRDWDLPYMNQILNYPKEVHDSPFGWGEHNMLGSSFYYNSGFSGALWRRWLGQAENKEGGRIQEEEGMGRMCLRPILHHPIKHEHGPEE